jgi:hypothetical protein
MRSSLLLFVAAFQLVFQLIPLVPRWRICALSWSSSPLFRRLPMLVVTKFDRFVEDKIVRFLRVVVDRSVYAIVEEAVIESKIQRCRLFPLDAGIRCAGPNRRDERISKLRLRRGIADQIIRERLVVPELLVSVLADGCPELELRECRDHARDGIVGNAPGNGR